MAQLTVENLALGYENTTLIQELSFTVQAGDYLCIVGENGSGKSTLLRTLLGLQPPLHGSVTLGDGLKQTEIGYLPQQTEVQRDFPASVREIVRSGCLGRMGARPFYGREEKRRAEEAMERLGVSTLAERCYRELSGGQQQRVLLARALCAAEKLLLLDEPVAGLDPRATDGMYRQIRRLNDEGVTIIMVTHDVQEAMRDADHILHIGGSCFYGVKGAYRQSSIGRKYLERGGERR